MKTQIFLILGGVLSLLSPLLHGETVISDSDFSRNGKELHLDYRSKGFGTFQGPLPKNWHENGASWQKSDTTAKLVRDSAGDYLTFTVSGAGTQ